MSNRLPRVALVLAGIVGLAAGPAQACRIGGDQILFDEAPVPALAGAQVIHVHFTNFGRDFERWNKPTTGTYRGTLIGIARLKSDGRRAGPRDRFPVYAGVTSCTHGFYGLPRPLWDRDAFLVGRFARDAGGRLVFVAGGNFNGRWHF